MAGRLESTSLPAGHSLLLRPAGSRSGGSKTAAPPPFALPTGPSALSSRLRSFLPELHAANAALVQRVEAEGAAAVDIEALAGGSAERVIEMDLAVAELGDSSSSEDDEGGSDDSDVGSGSGGGRAVVRGSDAGSGAGGAAGGPGGMPSAGGRRTSKRRPRILEIAVDDGVAPADAALCDGGGDGGNGGADEGASELRAADKGEEDLPAGVWVTDPSVLQRCKRDVLRMLAEAGDGESGGGRLVAALEPCGSSES